MTRNTKVHPTLVSKTGADAAYVLTAINQDKYLYMLYMLAVTAIGVGAVGILIGTAVLPRTH